MAHVMLNTKATENTIENKIKVVPGILEVEKELYYSVSDCNGKTKVICNNLIKAGGKRIRPLLVILSAQSVGPLNSKAIYTAVASELIHMASLVHDDIIDNSTIRRNGPSVNAQIGNESSVLLGDYLFAKAFEILSKNRLIEEMRLLVEAIGEMCDGEITQASNKYNLDQGIEDYYSRIYKKTGILIASCCQAGAVTAGANAKQIECLESYGRNIGYAFQITDDILDFIGDKKNLGKPIGNDLKEGNITLPIIKLLKHNEYKNWLEDILCNQGIIDENYREILRLLEDSYAIEESYAEAEKCIMTAKKALESLQDTDYKQMLISIADSVLIRKS